MTAGRAEAGSTFRVIPSGEEIVMPQTRQSLTWCSSTGCGAGIASAHRDLEEHSSGLAADLSNGKSGNWKPLGCAIALFAEVDQRSIESPEARRIIAEWVDYYAASRAQFMGGEFGNRIYGAWHVLSNLAVAAWKREDVPGQHERAGLARRLVAPVPRAARA